MPPYPPSDSGVHNQQDDMGVNNITVDVHQDLTIAENVGSNSSPFGAKRRRLPTLSKSPSKVKQRNKRRQRKQGWNKPARCNAISYFTLFVLCGYAYVSYQMYISLRNHPTDLSSRQVMQNQTQSEQEKPLSSSSSSFVVEDWEFDHDVVHVIQTRLMQSQPNLINLGLARLEFLRIFCLPTVMKQTSQNFLWIIRTDPALDYRLKTKLLEILGSHPNYLLVASNTNHEGWRGHNALEFRENDVWAGSYDLAVHFHKAAQTRLVLETRLDADDGLHDYFVENTQREARVYLDSSNKAAEVTAKPKWMVWCAYGHLEWQHSSPWSYKNNTNEYGFLIGIKKRDCITPGLTMGYGLGADRSDLPAGHHSKIHSLLPGCDDSNINNTHCLQRFGVLFPGAVRARSPTSAGMKRVIIGKYGDRHNFKQSEKQLSLQDIVWDGLEKAYGIFRSEAAVARHYITQHLVEICKENLKGQCTKGHSCKPSSVKYLQQLINNPPSED